jgi:hypothetical protein
MGYNKPIAINIAPVSRQTLFTEDEVIFTKKEVVEKIIESNPW